MKKIFSIIIMFYLISLQLTAKVSAHSVLLDVEYDDCNTNLESDMKWYSLSTYSSDNGGYEHYAHIGNNTEIIYFYMNETAENDSSYTWSSDVSLADANEIKNAYIESMYMWNNVYYYSYDEFGNRTSNRIIHIIQTQDISHANIIIYPISTSEYKANTSKIEDYHTNILESTLYDQNNEDKYLHEHISKFKMNVNVSSFAMPTPFDKEKFFEISDLRKRVGAHELGHVLGLGDLDRECQSTDENHHYNALMGYGIPQKEYITYNDIAGVSITRGFHTDNDHVWMKRINNNNNTIDLICALCNGVLYDVNIDENEIIYNNQKVNDYKNCEHYYQNNTTSNMLLVATNGEKDFFKCLNCRHIEEVDSVIDSTFRSSFSEVIFENSLSAQSEIYYKIDQQVDRAYNFTLTSTNGLDIEIFDKNLNIIDIDVNSDNLSNIYFSKYLEEGIYYIKIKNKNFTSDETFTLSIEEHTHNFQYIQDDESASHHIKICGECGYQINSSHVYDDHYCTFCNIYTSTHDYEAPYVWINIYNHSATCCCGETTTQVHAVKSGTTRCLLCGGNAGSGIVQMSANSNNIHLVTQNGSFITSEGIIVLVDKDISDYLNGTLIFDIKDDGYFDK